MRLLFCLLVMISFSALGETWELQKGKGMYEVKHLIKKVRSESTQLKGKMECSEKECEFLIAAPVKSFTSSDSNRDSNMFDTTEASKFPVTSARGKFPKEDLMKTGVWTLPVDVEFHGVKKQYQAKVERIKDQEFKSSFIFKLDQHQIDRPSLFGVKINDEVPMNFEISWLKKN